MISNYYFFLQMDDNLSEVFVGTVDIILLVDLVVDTGYQL